MRGSSRPVGVREWVNARLWKAVQRRREGVEMSTPNMEMHTGFTDENAGCLLRSDTERK